MEWIKNKKYAYIIAGACIIIICIIICVIIESNDKQENNFSIEDNTVVMNQSEVNKNEEEKEIIVHIAGEVNNPGIIKIKEGSRIIDVVEKAGGFTSEANLDKVNLAYEVRDEQKIVIPNVNDKNDDKSIIDESSSFIIEDNSNGDLININTATQSELESLSGIGPSMASKIIDYRDKSGNFKNKEDIKNVPGIGSSKYEAIKDEICVK